MAVKPNTELIESAMQRATADSSVATKGTLEELKTKSVINPSENIWVKGDMFTIPSTDEELVKVLVHEVYKNLPKNNVTGKYPEGFYILVTVKNGEYETVKRFRISALNASFREYTRSTANETYLATGRVISAYDNPKSRALSDLVMAKSNQYEQFKALAGKTLAVVDMKSGNAGSFDSTGKAIDIKRREIPVFETIEEPAAENK